MQILSNTLAFVFALGVIVFVHEAGHYLAAKAFGVRVLTFSLGFGRRIWSASRGGTEYRIAWIPLGGYVSFAGQDPTRPSDDPDAFLNHPRWQRISILAAGPLMNVILAVVLVTVVFATGSAIGSDPKDLPPVIGAVADDSRGEAAGLLATDRVVSIDGSEVGSWQQVDFAVLTSPDRPLEIEYERGGTLGRTRLVPEPTTTDGIGDAGLFSLVLVGEVIAGGAAEEAGFAVGDAILAVDGRPIRFFTDLIEHVGEREGEELRVTILRGEDRLMLAVRPRLVDGRAMIGVGQPQRSFSWAEAVGESVRFNADLTGQMLVLVRRLFERRISLRSSIGGPIQIAAISGAAARRGLRDLMLFMAFISLNLFIFNLLPIPILDGGQIAILLVESTIRRDLSLVLKERITQIGLAMIVMLMAMALYFDLSRNLPSVLSRSSPAGDEGTRNQN